MESTLKAAWRQDAATLWHAVEIVYPDFTLRLCDAGFIEIGGNLFEAEHATYGTLGQVEAFRDGGQDVAGSARITLQPPSGAAMRALTDRAAQMSPVTIYAGAFDPATGLIVGTPERPFVGYLDTGSESIGAGGWAVTLECITGEDRALDAGEGLRMSDPVHQSIWPGEKGFEFVTGVAEPVWWGVKPPAGSVTAGGGGTTGGGRPTPGRPIIWSVV